MSLLDTGTNSAGAPGGEREGPPRFVLVVDTDPGVRWAVEKGLTRTGYRVYAAPTAGEAMRIIHEETVDVLVLELLPEAGLTQEVLSSVVERPEAPQVVCVSVDAAPHNVIECMRRGAADFLPKPFSLSEMRNVLDRILTGSARRRTRPKPGTPAWGDSEASLLIGISPAMQELQGTIKQVARTDMNCLVRGESGTGKDLIARELHRLSRRHDKPFVKVNCTALPEQLLESELFGYEKGAFTGAISSKPGRFELANRGIIFLDEIGDMHPNLQAKLLQVLEHKEFTKLGGRKHIQVDVQIIAATNADLEQRIKEGAFRDDLYFRLNEVCIWVPPLSKRQEDIPLLVRHFLQKHGQFSSGQDIDLTGEDFTVLTRHEWPGNVRELESTIKRWLALGKTGLPLPGEGAALPPQEPATDKAAQSAPDAPGGAGQREGEQAESGTAGAEKSPDPPAAESAPPEKSEKERILDALHKHQWNRRKASESLGMSYQTLRRRIDKYDLKKSK